MVERKSSVVTPERFASGMSFEQWVAYVGSPENLAREGSGGSARRDWSGHLREAHKTARHPGGAATPRHSSTGGPP